MYKLAKRISAVIIRRAILQTFVTTGLMALISLYAFLKKEIDELIPTKGD